VGCQDKIYALAAGGPSNDSVSKPIRAPEESNLCCDLHALLRKQSKPHLTKPHLTTP